MCENFNNEFRNLAQETWKVFNMWPDFLLFK